MEVVPLIGLAWAALSWMRDRADGHTLAGALARAQERAATILQVKPLPLVARGVPTMATDGNAIYYNVDFLAEAVRHVCNQPACASGILLAMVSHELAHAYRHRCRAPGQQLELEADYVAGYVLGRASVSPDEFLVILDSLRASPTHPPPEQRKASCRRGYLRGQADALCGAGGRLPDPL